MACSIGTLLDLHDCAASLKNVVSELNPDEVYTLNLRSECTIEMLSVDSTICETHAEHFIFRLQFGRLQKCCNPFNLHNSKPPKGNTIVTVEQSQRIAHRYKLIPGLLLCITCKKEYFDL